MQEETTVGIIWYGDECFLLTKDTPNYTPQVGLHTQR